MKLWKKMVRNKTLNYFGLTEDDLKSTGAMVVDLISNSETIGEVLMGGLRVPKKNRLFAMFLIGMFASENRRLNSNSEVKNSRPDYVS